MTGDRWRDDYRRRRDEARNRYGRQEYGGEPSGDEPYYDRPEGQGRWDEHPGYAADRGRSDWNRGEQGSYSRNRWQGHGGYRGGEDRGWSGRYGGYGESGFAGRYGEDPSTHRDQRGRYGEGWNSRQSEGGRWSGQDDQRGFWDRAADEVSSWMGDDEAERRRQMDKQRSGKYGKGPRGYTRSDDRIREDVNDRLTDDWLIDATSITVTVQSGEVTLEGTVDSRDDKRRAEDVVESISGVRHVQNNLRVQPQSTSSGSWASGTSMSSGDATTTSESSKSGGGRSKL